MNSIQLREVDLNLLVVLDLLLQERSVTRAAERLDLTPSAVSHALKRLRKLFDDELLLRDGRRMRPTVRAEGLAATLPRVLEQVARTIASPEPFRPSSSTRTFRLAAPDFVAPLVPTLLQDVHGRAPGVQIELAPYSRAAARELADGRYDALIAPDASGDDDLRGEPLGSWTWVVYGRQGHPAFMNWSPTAWSEYPHLRVQTSGVVGEGPIDRWAEQFGVPRVVGATVPNFSMAAPILARTDLLLTAPSVAMSTSAAAFCLEHRELPAGLPDIRLSLYRSAAEGDEPGVRWFHDRVEAAFAGFDALGSRP